MMKFAMAFLLVSMMVMVFSTTAMAEEISPNKLKKCTFAEKVEETVTLHRIGRWTQVYICIPSGGEVTFRFIKGKDKEDWLTGPGLVIDSQVPFSHKGRKAKMVDDLSFYHLDGGKWKGYEEEGMVISFPEKFRGRKVFLLFRTLKMKLGF